MARRAAAVEERIKSKEVLQRKQVGDDGWRCSSANRSVMMDGWMSGLPGSPPTAPRVRVYAPSSPLQELLGTFRVLAETCVSCSHSSCRAHAPFAP